MVFAWLDPDRAVYPRTDHLRRARTPARACATSRRRRWPPRRTTPSPPRSARSTSRSRPGSVSPPWRRAARPTASSSPATSSSRSTAAPRQDVSDVTEQIRPLPVGSDVEMTVRRGGELRRVELTTTSAPDDPKASAVRVSIQAAGYRFPFQVDLKLDENIGGPSAGPDVRDRHLRRADARDRSPAARRSPARARSTAKGKRRPHRRDPAEAGRRPGRRRAKLFLVPADNCAEAAARSLRPRPDAAGEGDHARRRGRRREGLGQGP